MHLRPVRRAITLALISALAVTGVASADTVRGKSDVIQGGAALIDIGEVAPSALVTVEVDFDLICAGTNHPDEGQTVGLAYAGGSPAAGGAIVSASGASIGPVPASWPDDGETCPDPLPVLGSTTALVTLRAPATPNVGYTYTLGWSRSVAPSGNADGTAINGGTATAVAFRLAVVTNTAPILALPADMTVEADTTGGWVAAYTVSASDAEDDPDPAPICSPAAGEVLPLGSTTVACHATDAGGRVANGTFDVTVVDTTAPSITVGGDQDVTTDHASGSALAYDPPVVADVADPSPSVACDPVPGTTIPVGTTTVTCVATDASGNPAAASLTVTVRYEPPPPTSTPVATVTWLEPIGAGTTTFVAKHGRTIPVKAVLAIDGSPVTTGPATLMVAPCGGGTPVELAMSFGGGRWRVLLDTSDLRGPCHVVTAMIDGHVAGAFTLELRSVASAESDEADAKAKDKAKAKAKDKDKAKAKAKDKAKAKGHHAVKLTGAAVGRTR